MDQVHVVRHKVLVEGQAVRRVAREMGIARNTVRKYLAQSEPLRVEKEPRARPVREKVVPRIEALLEESPRWTGGKQRLTAARLHTMLVVEGFEVGQTTVKAAVAEWKRKRREVFVPLVYPAGDLAEVDFFEVLVELTGTMVKAWMFVMRLMHSGRDFAWLYLRQDQPSFLDGHVRAFEHFGCRWPRRSARACTRAPGTHRKQRASYDALERPRSLREGLAAVAAAISGH
jgi:transposase